MVFSFELINLVELSNFLIIKTSTDFRYHQLPPHLQDNTYLQLHIFYNSVITRILMEMVPQLEIWNFIWNQKKI